MSNIVLAQAEKLAKTLNVDGTGGELVSTLKATAFKGQVSDAQMAALLIVANQYGLSPWTKEIYAFPDRNNGIVPVVGVDGWSRIINSDPNFDGMEFEQDAESCTCKIYRKDRSKAVAVTEFMDECNRKTGPWQSHPKRMLRHKAMIQCARLAFGFAGIYDQDEAERIVERDITTQTNHDIAASALPSGEDSEEALFLISELATFAENGDWAGLAGAWKSYSEQQKESVGAARFNEIKNLCKNNMPGD